MDEEREFCLTESEIRQRILTYRKLLRHWTSGFTSHPMEGVLRNFITLKNPSSRQGLNPRPLGPVASTLTATPPRRLDETYIDTLKTSDH
jgi:hypothetical protein